MKARVTSYPSPAQPGHFLGSGPRCCWGRRAKRSPWSLREWPCQSPCPRMQKGRRSCPLAASPTWYVKLLPRFCDELKAHLQLQHAVQRDTAAKHVKESPYVPRSFRLLAGQAVDRSYGLGPISLCESRWPPLSLKARMGVFNAYRNAVG